MKRFSALPASIPKSRFVWQIRGIVFAGVSAMTMDFAAATPPSEVKVFTDEISNVGEHSMEIHVNSARLREIPPGWRSSVLQIMPEYSYGIAKDWELSLQLPMARLGRDWRISGVRAELQYIAPHDDDDGGYWGWNVELSRNSPLGARRSTTLEVIPIVGYREDDWHVVFNPGFTIPVAGDSSRATFEPSAKIAYQLKKDNYIGFEHYWELGPIRHFEARRERYQMLYAVWDSKIGKTDFNFGIGRGRTDASDKWAVKMMLDFPL